MSLFQHRPHRPSIVKQGWVHVDPVEFKIVKLSNGAFRLEEMSLRRLFNVPQLLTDPKLQPFITSRLRQRAQLQAFRKSAFQQGYGYVPQLLAELCQMYLAAWEAEALPASEQERVELCATLYWHLAGFGADQNTRRVFGEPERFA